MSSELISNVLFARLNIVVASVKLSASCLSTTPTPLFDAKPVIRLLARGESLETKLRLICFVIYL